jgi:hypothetical protein
MGMTSLVEMLIARLNVASLANLPAEVIAIAGEKARIMEEETKQREQQRWYDQSFIKQKLTLGTRKRGISSRAKSSTSIP